MHIALVIDALQNAGTPRYHGSLAFVTALQLLPPRQRAAIVLRDVMGFPACEAARVLGTAEESVTSALKLGAHVLTLFGTQISAMTRFDVGILPRFELPGSLALSR